MKTAILALLLCGCATVPPTECVAPEGQVCVSEATGDALLERLKKLRQEVQSCWDGRTT